MTQPGQATGRNAPRRLAALFPVSWILPLLFLGLWELIARQAWIPAYLFPPPSEVLHELELLVDRGELLRHVGISSYRVLVGFVLGAGVATLMGALTGYFSLFRQLWDGLLQSLRSVPVIAWVPIFILWIGIGEGSKIALIALGAFFPVYVNLMAGVQSVDRKLVEVGRANRLHGLRLIRKIYMPATLPSYFMGLRIGMGLSWMFVAAAELIGASEGIGYLLLYGQNMGRPALILASMMLFAVAGKLTDMFFVVLQRRLLSWQDTAK